MTDSCGTVHCVHTVTEEYFIIIRYQVSHCLPDRYYCIYSETHEYFINMGYQENQRVCPTSL